MESGDKDTDLFHSFRGFLILGRCLGLLPITGVFKPSQSHWKCRLKSFAALTSISCILLLTFNLIIVIGDAIGLQKRNAKEIAYAIGHPVFATWGLFMYTYFLLRRQSFIEIFKAWSKCTLSLEYTQKDSLLKRTVIFISTAMLSSTVLENAVLHLEYFAVFDSINGHTVKFGEEKNRNASLLQMYYWRAHLCWSNVIGYNPVLAVLAFINHKLILYGGNYVDIMIALLARALYFKFSTLNKKASDILLQPTISTEKINVTPSSSALGPVAISERDAWNKLVKDHDNLCNIMNAMNRFFSPVIFVSYTINIYYFCMQLLYQLNPDVKRTGIVHAIYSPWSFLHVIVRLFLISICMATVNEEAHKTREIVMHCPDQLFGGPVAKLDRKLNTGPQIGFTGLNCFVVKKPFMLHILNVVFTIEIVLMQGIQVEPGSKDVQKIGRAAG